MTSRFRPLCWTGLGAVLAGDAVAYGLLVGSENLGTARLLEGIAAVCWVLAVVLLAVLRPGRRVTAAVVLGGGVLLGVLALVHPPSTSTDEYRYIWDGKVQLAGIDPYLYTPASPQLAHLRDPSLFGPPDHCLSHFPGGCTSINRPTVHTIYPPVAEGGFTLVRLVTFGGHGGRLPFQVAGLLGSLAIASLLLRWGGPRGRPWLAAVWMWCPTVITELVNDAHIDWLGVLLVVLAYATPLVRRTGWAGALVGGAIATKLYPVLALPSLMRRRPFLAVVAAIAVVVVVYIPHLVAAGGAVLGYLPGYLSENNYGNGSRLLLIGWVLPSPADTVVGVVLVLAASVWAWRRGNPLMPANTAVVVTGVALLAFTPRYGWYAALLIVFVAMSGAWEWAPVGLAGTFAYYQVDPGGRYWYLGALVLVAVLLLVRISLRRRRLRWWGAPRPLPPRRRPRPPRWFRASNPGRARPRPVRPRPARARVVRPKPVRPRPSHPRPPLRRPRPAAPLSSA